MTIGMIGCPADPEHALLLGWTDSTSTQREGSLAFGRLSYIIEHTFIEHVPLCVSAAP